MSNVKVLVLVTFPGMLFLDRLPTMLNLHKRGTLLIVLLNNIISVHLYFFLSFDTLGVNFFIHTRIMRTLEVEDI